MDLLNSVQSIATLIFVLGSTAVGVKLLLLSSRTKQLPELLLGASILCTGGLGYGLLIAAIVIRGTEPMAPADVPALSVALAAIGRTIHNVGVTLYLGFMVYVFRRSAGWAYALAGVAALLLWGGFLVGVGQGSLRNVGVGGAAWFAEYVVIWGYPVWNAIESFRYYGLMRRRASLGLADPIVTNRFLLWGTGSVFAALAIWTASVPFVFASDVARLEAITPAIRIVTAILGVVSVSCSLLAFLPPTWYRRRIVSLGSTPATAL